MKDNDTNKLETLYESVNAKPGPVAVATWPSHKDKTVIHTLTYSPTPNIFIDIATSNGNVIERKEVDGNDLQKYINWYTPEIINKMKDVMKSVKSPMPE